MRVTFLGHQGWQFENDRGRSFLLDPIYEEMGNGDVRLPVWPARRLDLEKMAPIEAVIISHEHADHFSLDTLDRLPRRCRILISDLASRAMEGAIEALGFRVERFTALQTLNLVGLKVTPLPALYNTLEPDVYALLVEDDSRASFLTAIDTVPHPDLFAWLASHCPVRTLDNLTNNFIESRHALIDDPASHRDSRAKVAGTTLDFVRQFRPRRAVIAGQGWSFVGDKTALNHHYFSVDNQWLTEAARRFAPHVEWFEGKPGMRFTLRGSDLSVDQARITIDGKLVDRTFAPDAIDRSRAYSPWTGTWTLPEDRLGAVKRFVSDTLGGVLGSHSPKLMESLYYLKSMVGTKLSPTLGVALKNGTSTSVYEFDYGRLSFRESPNAARVPAVGIEIWASDLEHLIGAREEVFMVYESAVRPWSHVPTAIPSSQLIECFMWFTPRFRPAETLAFYKEQIARFPHSRWNTKAG